MRIKKEVLKNLLQMCASTPTEVGGLLLGNPVDDFVLVPGKLTANSVYIFMDRLPIYPNLRGTFHSHPGSIAMPSRADLDLFGKIGKEHLILAPPFDLNSTAAYDSKGKKSELKII